MPTITRCECGKRMSRDAQRCKGCEAKRCAERIAEAQAIVDTGTCPKCGYPLKRNLALAGWYQCVGYGEPYLRAAEYRSVPKCSFQIFAT